VIPRQRLPQDIVGRMPEDDYHGCIAPIFSEIKGDWHYNNARELLQRDDVRSTVFPRRVEALITAYLQYMFGKEEIGPTEVRTRQHLVSDMYPIGDDRDDFIRLIYQKSNEGIQTYLRQHNVSEGQIIAIFPPTGPDRALGA
jgi:hypothetical protein